MNFVNCNIANTKMEYGLITGILGSLLLRLLLLSDELLVILLAFTSFPASYIPPPTRKSLLLNCKKQSYQLLGAAFFKSGLSSSRTNLR
jgi:hypothetical protein